MSDLREELLRGGVNKKRVIAIALVAMLLVAMFAFSTVLFSFLFGTQRPYPSREKSKTDYEDADLIKPPYPFDEDFWQDLLDQVDDPASLLDMLSEMFDGDIDDLDLGNFSQGLLDLLYSQAGEMEVFRVYNYLSFDDMSDVLWKFECFDEYTGEGWTSNAGTNIYDFYSYGDYLANYFPDPELLKLRMPLSPNSGINSMVIPTLFPTPFLIDGSFALDPGTPNFLDPGSLTLYKDEYNSTTLDLSFSTDDDVNMTFNLFGFYNYLPTPQELNNSAVEAVWTPTYIKNKYLQLPPTIQIYKTNNPYFNTHFNILDGMIDSNDNAFWAANIIRSYLQTQFSFPLDPSLYNPAPEGTDQVEWFCETEQGLWSDFASAFCAFARSFGISCRFVDGFNGFLIEEFEDPREPYGANNTFAIKYKNLYSWAEIYVPTSISGDGQWVQFDIFDTFGGAGNPIMGGNYNITVVTDQLMYTRPDTAIITATVKNTTATDPIDGLTITFTDLTTGQDLGQDITNINGRASVLFPINNSHVVGPHVIQARYDVFNAGYNVTSILGNISVVLTNVNPWEINISDALPDSTNIQGYLYDPLNGQRVKDANVNITLVQRGTYNEVPNAFDPPSIVTDSLGVFDNILDLTPFVTAGQYEVRADFNGTWILGPRSITIGMITNSSNRIELNVSKVLDVWFYIESMASNYPYIPPSYPVVSRYQPLNLTAVVYSATAGPIPNRLVSFYDYSRGDILIGTDISDANGIASISYVVGDYCVAGPNLLYAVIGLQENYSYFVLNEKPTINIISGPTPRVINRTGSGATQFNIVGEIFDSTNNSLPISYSEIILTLLKGGVNYSSYLVPSESYPFQTDSTGTFDLNFGVLPNTPPGNYTLRLDFNGTINLLSYPYSYQFDLPILSNSAFCINELKIEAEASLLFWINGASYDDYDNPRINRDDDLELTAYIHVAGVPIDDGEIVEFYDITQDNLFIGSGITNSGNATIIYDTNGNTVAGPHLIYATWNNKFNYSYFILDDEISINLDIWPQNREISKFGTVDTTFFIQGYLNDTNNSQPIKYGEISIHIFDGGEIIGGLILVSGSYQSNQFGEISAEFRVSNFVDIGNYTLEVWFNGTFIYSSPNNIYNQ
ncbi:MAG: transglutaminase domain-containing protein, partial [Promethearchaeota archaeon]